MTDATSTNLVDMTGKELIAVYNDLAQQLNYVDAPELTSWKKPKAALVERIEDLQNQVRMAEVARGDDFEAVMNGEKPVSQEEATAAAEAAAEQFKAENLEAQLEPLPSERDETPDETSDETETTDAVKSDRTIKAASVELLCHVAFYEDRDEKIDPEKNVVEASNPKARSVGLAYDEIIRRIQDEFPGCSTTVACLRWYSVKIRVEEHGYEDLRLPQRRPRAKPRTAK